jgi:peptidoglycan/xylan/chitin deacetylase (PgdA/CDA1 family)
MPKDIDSASSPHENRRNRYRRYLAMATVLMTISVVTTACLPNAVPPRDPSASPVQKPSTPSSGTTVPPKVVPPIELPPEPPVVKPPDPTPTPVVKPPDLPVGQPSQLVVNGDRSCPQIALTYDAGSAADGAEAILDMLKRQGVKSTFFLTGKWVEKYPDLAKRIAAEGHEIANHTYSHADLTKATDAEVLAEIKAGEEAIRKITGKETRPLFREPYGAFNDHERRLVRQAGFSYSIYWDVDTLDWQFPGVDAEFKKLTERTRNGSIVLMHLNVPDSAIASERAIPVLKAKGFKLVTISSLLKCS